MRAMQGKTGVGKTALQLAKAAMRIQAVSELTGAKLPSTAKVTIEYNGVSHVLAATPTVNAENGQILFHFGAVGNSRLHFGETEATGALSFAVGGNVMTGLQIDNFAGYCEKYGLTPAKTEEDLDAGESTN